MPVLLLDGQCSFVILVIVGLFFLLSLILLVILLAIVGKDVIRDYYAAIVIDYIVIFATFVIVC